jgi:hydroxymethylpyrimidine/phosphomethylpyrimidine kinase
MTRRIACALAVGGLDPGGGAGVLADARGIDAAGALACAAVAVVTVQSTSGMRSARAVDAREVLAEAREVLAHQRVRAFKIGALGSRANVLAVGALLREHAHVPAVVDTPMLATRRAPSTRARSRPRLLDAGAVDAMRAALVPRAALVTVNAAEASVLTEAKVEDVGGAHDAACALVKLGARAALVKGGHFGDADAIDVLAVGDEVIELRARRLAVRAHGTGCTLASLVAGRLAVRAKTRVDDAAIVDAVRWAKRIHHAALANARDAGGAQRVLVFD